MAITSGRVDSKDREYREYSRSYKEMLCCNDSPISLDWVLGACSISYSAQLYGVSANSVHGFGGFNLE